MGVTLGETNSNIKTGRKDEGKKKKKKPVI